jgi:molybdopterin biosynthesis enzyme
MDAPLTSLDGALELLCAHCAPAAQLLVDIRESVGASISCDVAAPSCLPARDSAARDGFAAASVDLIGASSFNPSFLMVAPVAVSVGDVMPDGCDCVVDFGCVSAEGPPFTISVSAAPGQGVRRMGADVNAGSVLLCAGSQMSAVDVALLQIAGVSKVSVRQPRVCIVGVPSADHCTHTFDFMSALAEQAGVLLEQVICASRSADDIEQKISLRNGVVAAPDLLITIGGSGAGLADYSVDALRRTGAQMCHGLALSGGTTIGFGRLHGCLVIALPGRFEGALGGWLALVMPVLQLLFAIRQPEPLQSGPLLRKVSSAPGMSDVVLMERNSNGWAPSLAGDMSVAQALRAEGYLLLGAGSEGLAEGAVVRPLPLPGQWRARS